MNEHEWSRLESRVAALESAARGPVRASDLPALEVEHVGDVECVIDGGLDERPRIVLTGTRQAIAAWGGLLGKFVRPAVVEDVSGVEVATPARSLREDYEAGVLVPPEDDGYCETDVDEAAALGLVVPPATPDAESFVITRWNPKAGAREFMSGSCDEDGPRWAESLDGADRWTVASSAAHHIRRKTWKIVTTSMVPALVAEDVRRSALRADEASRLAAGGAE